MRLILSRFVACGQGATAVEYGLIALFMSGAIIAGFPAVRDAVQTLYETVSGSVASAGS
ncbi:Flp family type IVb pilin [Kaistia geumhonensis]|uniref:Flp pilus assembly pilin Flp n=1 Tax=Kaistia geumhonensis TaxID=410839 RepID=A0ABU0MAQ6_9HYPH|nr:Flp family type IVb pilin [Kaistia geumhonensis]MCX5480442.1 Flp family type IVb pilin [Kaistia geumhonensis]MDQ0517858.1 Flp pilus assembly pilin Flp [Kaistia geumhonensis]